LENGVAHSNVSLVLRHNLVYFGPQMENRTGLWLTVGQLLLW